ncbi:MAG TPA: S8 family serine peptidase [Candidatus Sumerlaeota bacterium]|nr:S8 family serine peptidase [Candidatus Sumerlaeota bacterium]
MTAQSVPIIPPPPSIVPVLPNISADDYDGSKVDDRLESELFTRRAARAKAVTPEEIAGTQEAVGEVVRVEVVLRVPVRADHIRDFEKVGGSVDRIYRNASYGWIGDISRPSLEAAAAALGNDLIGIIGDKEVHATLYEATRNGRARTVWASNFAGVASGFSGNATTTIGIIDSGNDNNHPDLNGRMEFFYNATTEGGTTPIDLNGHGTHVTGIAIGSGAAQTDGTISFSETEQMTSSVPSGNFFPSEFFPGGGLTGNFTTLAAWDGGGVATVHNVRNSGSGWTTLGAGTAGSSPVTLTHSITTIAGNQYSSAVLQNATNTVGNLRTTTTSPYPVPADGFKALRGVASGAHWAGLKGLNANRSGSLTDISEAIDEAISQRTDHNIKLLNMSLGGAVDTSFRAKVTTAVNNGILVVAAAGNDGLTNGTVTDPGLAGKAMTVAASNNANALTNYTSLGLTSPPEDMKPDIVAPGGSFTLGGILSADTNDADNYVTSGGVVTSMSDLTANDYRRMNGTSMAAPFVSGAAALVIQALELQGTVWDFDTDTHPRLVKMLLLATATETNANREGSANNPTLGRGTTPKDRFEGYGMINTDAAIEAVMLEFSGTTFSDTFTGGAFDRRAAARYIDATTGMSIDLLLTVPSTADYDLYLYRPTPDSFGNPVIAASSTQAGNDTDEVIDYTAVANERLIMVIKRVSGSGLYVASGTLTTPSPTPSPSPSPTASQTPSATASPSPSISPSPSLTPSLTASATPSATPSLTASPSLTPSQTASLTPSPTASPSVSPSLTPSPTSSLTPSQTASLTPSLSPPPSATPSLTASPSLTPSQTPSLTASPSATASQTPSLTASPSATNSPTPSLTASPSLTPSQTPSLTASPSATASLTPSPTASPSATNSPTPSLTASPSATNSPTPSLTASATPSATSSLTASPTAPQTPSVTASSTATPSPTSGATQTPTVSPSATAIGTQSLTPTISSSATATPTVSPSISPTATQAPTASPTAAATQTASPSPSPIVLDDPINRLLGITNTTNADYNGDSIIDAADIMQSLVK